ncbi:DUF1254 domain-containing protein [Mycolicibacterium aichiense]|uniref:Membrane protein n=1 Tax=Mycolicibacterium aichiense TaxID=1799 RepID=A0AAD1HNT5_9MYCO|nr:DUF1254 domain-containing protein [Mycolicibacterium aichiense]MCV7018480.1 DUF1254 domain-containing protein [Mycolicibacterium aichiense]BBX07236.1 membrane protein [Mycolicibacterium aichiense]STZ81050.1 Uncharacterized conserved protein [Mycolicibacterium aichiense]
MSTLSSDLRTLSYEAYIYFYPLVTMDVSRLQTLNRSGIGAGPPNEFHHIRQYPDAAFRAVVRPNFDTLYSSAWLDLTGGPVILDVPDTDDRYFMLPLLDMWTDVFANPGKRTSGTGPQRYVIVGPGHSGDLPQGIPVIHAPTPYVWIIGRTQTNGPADYPAVHAVQDGYTLTPLATSTFVRDEAYDVTTEPLRTVNGMAALDYLSYAADLLRVNPPHSTDFSILARLSGLGIEAGTPFDAQRFSPEQRTEIEAGAQDALAAITSSAPTLGNIVDGWMTLSEGMGVYGNAYLRRAVVTLVGLGANPPEDAVYPMLVTDADGQPLTGENDYVIHFDAGKLPPVDAFWSVTMYDAEGYQVANEIDRFAIGDRDALQYNADGSLDLYLQHSNPGPEKAANWLPAPLGTLGVTMRLYAPRREAISGAWHPPAVRKV